VATPAGFYSIHNDESDKDDIILRTGIWAPGLPILRAVPYVFCAAAAGMDVVDSHREKGKEENYTGASLGAFCTC